MGLDMRLSKRTYIGNHYRSPEELITIKFGKPKKPSILVGKVDGIKQERVSEIVESVGYWRKANAIHNWFVKHIQNGVDDCKEYYVSKDGLQELLDTVKTVIAGSKLVKGKIQNGIRWTPENGEEKIMEDGEYIEDPTIAKKLLPTTDGCFFGSTDYNQFYYQDLLDTKAILETAIAEDGDYYYDASW